MQLQCGVKKKKEYQEKTNSSRDLAQMPVHYRQLTGAKKTEAIPVKHCAKFEKTSLKKQTNLNIL